MKQPQLPRFGRSNKNLARDPWEQTDVAARHPGIVKQLAKIMQAQHTQSAL